MGTRGGRRPGAGRKKGSKNKRQRADLIVKDYEAGLLPAPFMLSRDGALYQDWNRGSDEGGAADRGVDCSVFSPALGGEGSYQQFTTLATNSTHC